MTPVAQITVKPYFTNKEEGRARGWTSFLALCNMAITMYQVDDAASPGKRKTAATPFDRQWFRLQAEKAVIVGFRVRTR